MNINKFSIFGLALLLQAISVNANASDISGVTPVQSGSSSIYNINPSYKNNNGTGFRQYGKFELSKGDNANFIMNDISKFVNLVDSKVSIDGLVNTVNSDFSKSNGSLIFVTPEGFVVGANGVLNVGSLSVYAPTQEGYKTLSNQLSEAVKDNTQNLTFDPSNMVIGNGLITINGKVIANGDISFNAKSITVGSDGRVISGLSADNTFLSYDKNTGKIELATTEDLFNTLVNTGKLNSEKTDITYNTNGGNIELGGLTENKNGNINLKAQNGNVVNVGVLDTQLKAGGDINILTKNGSVGEVPTENGDFSKSVNIQSEGKVNIYADNIVNVASLDKDLYVDNITGDTVYLTVDNATSDVNPSLYSANNTTPNVIGNNISIKASGNVGTSEQRFTVSSNSQSQVFDDNSWNNNNFSYKPKSDGIDVVSTKGSIYLKDNDTSSNIKHLSAEKGKVDAQFKGNTYIENLSAANANILTQGDVLYVENFQSDTILDDTTNKFTALGLSEKTKLSDSTVVLKNGTISTNDKTPILAFSADNIYADGKHFVMGKDRSQTPIDNPNGENVFYVGETKVVDNDNTSKIDVIGDNSVTIVAKPVSEDEVSEVDGLTRVYYKSPDGIEEIEYTVNAGNDTNSKVLLLDEPSFGDNDDDGDVDIPDIGDDDTDPDLDGGDTDSDSDNDTKEPDISGDNKDTDPDNPNIGDTDSDDDVDTPDPGHGDTDDDSDVDVPPASGEPDVGDNDKDPDTDIPTGDTDSDDDIDVPDPGHGDTDDDSDVDVPPAPGEPDVGDNDKDPDTDIPTGDTDSDDDIDVPDPGHGDTDDDSDIDVPPTPEEPDIGDTDTDDDTDIKPPHGDTDDDNDSDIPSVAPDLSDIKPIIDNNTQYPKPLSLITDVLVVPTNDDENDYSVERAVNTNGLFGDMEQRTDQILAPIRREAAKKRKFDFRWWFR